MNIVNWFLGNPFALVLLSLATGAGLLALGAWVYPILKNKVQGYPGETEIEAALLPYLLKGIIAAYKMSEDAIDLTGERLRGLDKKAIADALYDLLPPTIGGIPVGLIKTLITREKFAELVQGAFDRAMQLYEFNQAAFEKAYQDWLNGNENKLGGNIRSGF